MECVGEGGVELPIERDAKIEFHELGTLQSVTRWISKHEEGIAEWLKNARRAYQRDRAKVAEPHRVAVLLFRDEDEDFCCRIGLLDVGGATMEDLVRWSVWQDPYASSGGNGLVEEETQGNGGKTAMYRLFSGQARIVGVRDGKFNCKGFEGEPNSLDRGRPGYIPDTDEGKDRPVESWKSELDNVLQSYGLESHQLPKEVFDAIQARESFTLVEGATPIDAAPTVWKGAISDDDLIRRVLRQEQSTLAIEQLRIYAINNGEIVNSGKRLTLEEISSYPGFERPIVHEIPEYLPDAGGIERSTTQQGEKPLGKLTIRTSCDNMATAWRRLKPRWKVSYRTRYQMIGAKSVAELVPTTPGCQFVYGMVELDALEPDYVTLGRNRPKDGPVIEAVDIWIADRIREVASRISSLMRQGQDEETLDEIQEENQKLDQWKNRFLVFEGEGGTGGDGEDGSGGAHRRKKASNVDWGQKPNYISFGTTKRQFRLGKDVSVHLQPLLTPVVRDELGRPVGAAVVEYVSNDLNILAFTEDDTDEVMGLSKGSSSVRVRVKGTSVVSEPIEFEVWDVDHVMLAPRDLEIPIGDRRQVIAIVTNDEGKRKDDVLLNWNHSADDPLILRISSRGWITGNRQGITNVVAGTGDPNEGGVWARIPSRVEVIPNLDPLGPGGGFPRLLLTGRDIDPATDHIRLGDPEQPTLWQEPSDVMHNVWWLNLESPGAKFALSKRDDMSELWRMFHASNVVEMVAQAHMQREYTSKGDSERPETWDRHKAIYEDIHIQFAGSMWEKLQEYVKTGGGLE